MGKSDAPPTMVKGVFSPVIAPCDELDLNHAYSSSPAIWRVPMDFGGPSKGDGFVGNLFIQEGGNNMGAPEVFDGMTDALYGYADLHISSYYCCSLG
jgi:hypothetical protein